MPTPIMNSPLLDNFLVMISNQVAKYDPSKQSQTESLNRLFLGAQNSLGGMSKLLPADVLATYQTKFDALRAKFDEKVGTPTA
jgi:hypothetical protein